MGFIWLLVRSILSRSNPSNMTRITNVNGNSCIARGSMGAGPEEEMWSVLKKRMNVIHEDAKKKQSAIKVYSDSNTGRRQNRQIFYRKQEKPHFSYIQHLRPQIQAVHLFLF